MSDWMPLGEPNRYDVESAAKLYVEYDAKGLLDDDVAHSFAMMVEDFEAVYARALELKSQATEPDKPQPLA